MNPDARRRAGERVVALPPSALSMLRSRFVSGERLDQPLFPDVLGGFRDPANVRREFREARGEAALAWITSYSFRKTTATILDEAARRRDWSRTSSATPGRR
jgi:integrase